MPINAITPILFSFKGHTIRTVEVEGLMWYVATDVCEALCIDDLEDATAQLDQREVFRLTIAQHLNIPSILITEAVVYKLIMRSETPDALAFQDWIACAVLPALEHDGGYIMDEEKVVTKAGGRSLAIRRFEAETDEAQSWIVNVVLPAIRRDGGYIKGEEYVVTGVIDEAELRALCAEVMRKKNARRRGIN